MRPASDGIVEYASAPKLPAGATSRSELSRVSNKALGQKSVGVSASKGCTTPVTGSTPHCCATVDFGGFQAPTGAGFAWYCPEDGLSRTCTRRITALGCGLTQADGPSAAPGNAGNHVEAPAAGPFQSHCAVI